MKNSLNLLIFTLFVFFALPQFANAQKEKPYNPKADAEKEINIAVKKAAENNKHVLLVIGGNWCPWCLKINQYFKTNEAVKSFLEKNYEVVKVNYSKEVKNMPIMERLGFPQRFGFPVLVILNEKGERIHTQNSAYLEENKGYSEKIMLRFLKNWRRGALNPKNYKK